jgi:hypothetical protein
MPVFADRMKELTDHLRVSIEDRTDALGQVHQATHHLLGAARTFMTNVADEHHERAEELHETLEEFRGELADRVDEMREHHRDRLEHMSAETRKKLDETNVARHEAVKSMRSTFHKAQQEVAADLRDAGQAWREFTVNRTAQATHKPAAESDEETQVAAPQHGTKPRQPKSKGRGK